MYAAQGIRPSNNDLYNSFQEIYTGNSANSGYPWLNQTNRSKSMLSSGNLFGSTDKVRSAGYCVIKGRVVAAVSRYDKPGRYYLNKGKLAKVPKGKRCYGTRAEAEENAGKTKTIIIYKNGKKRRRKSSWNNYYRRNWLYPYRYYPYYYYYRNPTLLTPLSSTSNTASRAASVKNVVTLTKLPEGDKLVRKSVTESQVPSPSKFGSSIDYNYAINQYAQNAGTPTMKNLYQIGSEFFTEV